MDVTIRRSTHRWPQPGLLQVVGALDSVAATLPKADGVSTYHVAGERARNEVWNEPDGSYICDRLTGLVQYFESRITAPEASLVREFASVGQPEAGIEWLCEILAYRAIPLDGSVRRQLEALATRIDSDLAHNALSACP